VADLRLRGLAKVDPRAVPLPAGTEVGTRVDRVVAERRVPQGAVGRVVAVTGSEVDVAIVGVGVVRYARDELVPRKQGQLAYAVRREAAWQALRGGVVLEATVGSRAWGLAHEGSDTDVRGVFVWPLAWASALAEPATDLVSGDGSTTYWEFGKAVRQALRADPNTLEMLFVRGVRAVDPIGEWLLAERDAFVSIEIHGTFGRYAVSQLDRLTHMLRLAEHRHVVMDWLREDPVPELDEVSRRLGALSARPGQRPADAVAQGKEYVKQLYGSLYDQGQLPSREFADLVALARREGPKFELPRELRPKNAYHLLRLISTAIDWLKTGEVNLEVPEPLRTTLLAIKHGELALADVVRMADALTPELEAARVSSPLPRRPDVARADALLRRVREEVARRAVLREPGPLGADAPPAPQVGWEDD